MAPRIVVRRGAATLAIAVAILRHPGALAASGPGDEAMAEALFREARALMDAGHADQACPKLLESSRLDPAAGTLLNLGDCYEQTGRTASAWGAFMQAEALARGRGDEVRRQEALRRARMLEPKLSRLTIVVPEARRSPGLSVRRNGEVIGEALWGSALPVDPGRYTVEATAAGRARWSGSVEVGAGGDAATLVVPALAPSPPTPPPRSERRPAPVAGGWSAQRTAGVVVGGAGAVGLIVGAAFGARAIGKNGDLEKRCPTGDPRVCDATGVELHDEAVMAANVSNVAFAIGGAAVGAGVVLFITAPDAVPALAAAPASAPRVEASVRAGPAGTAVM
ncbi:MAG: hypothetical protein IT372_29765, partial [Polyangiaceae bacterium]|nr:hypothetical protein [Polyangiaceae bacterium]